VSVTTFADPATRPAGERIVVTRDPAGLIAAVTNPSGETTSYQRDALGNVTRITDHLQNAIQLDYGVAGCGCATGNVTKVTYPNGTTIAFEYDGLDRLRRRTDRLGRTSLWTHDPEGSVLTWQNRNGETVRYGYDLLGRLVRKELPGNEVVTFAYDLAGNLASAADPFCVLELQHDAFHRLTQATTLLELPIGTGAPQTLAHTLGYTYDRVGNRTAMVDSFGVASLAYTYDDLHRPRTVSRATDPSQRWSFAYDAAGRRTTTTIAKSGVVTTDLWDRARNLVARVAQTAPAAGVATVHDPSGRANAETRVLGPVPETWAFAYDGAGRLTAAAATALFGDTRVSRTHTYDVDGRLRSDGEYDYTFDPEGRLVQRGRIGSTLTDRYTYDAEGRQRSHVQTFDSGTGPVTLLTVRYCHDPLGRRIAKDVNGVTTRYVHDRDDVLHEVDLLNRVERSYVHGSGVDEHLAVLDAVTGRVLHVHQDRLGSVVALSDDSGALVQRYRYDEFGNLIGESDPSLFFAFAFTGRERDDETGWYHLRARAYDPRIGRFLREDPLGTDGGFNLYAYVENDPINLTDPFGLQSSNPFDLCSPCEPVCRLATTPGTADPQMAMECNRCRERCRKLQKCTPGECLKAYSIFGLVFCVARAAPRCVME
jgi:RHS repeat-associated protein